jgi:plastocyanin
MVLFAPLVGAAVFLSGFATAIPTGYSSSSSSGYDSSSGSSSSDSSSSNYGGDSSGDSSSNYGGDSGSSYGNSGTSDSSYGGGSSDYSSDSSYGDSYSSSMMMDDSTSTTTAYNSYETSTGYGSSSYGSGSNNWGGNGYEDCVNQCIAQFGSGMEGTYQATQTASTGGYTGSSGTGATHTVIVAPTKGVFRMMPFATNASVGDTIEFHWGADQHTVTKSSALLPCNKSSDAPVFASGEQNQSFVFTQVVNDTDPTFYYCGTPNHCEMGMFGIINPQMATPGSPTSAGQMMASMAANNSDISAYAAYVNNATTNNAAAGDWGAGIDMSSVPPWAQEPMAQNIMFTRAALAKNPGIMGANGAIDMSGVATQPLNVPIDPTMINAASSGSAAASASVAPIAAAPTPAGDAVSASASASSSGSSGSSSSNGASSVASPRFLVAAVVVLATIFAL